MIKIKSLQCPFCFSILKQDKETLICIRNKHKFLVQEGIPVLLDYKNLPAHSQNQQSYFEEINKTQIVDSPDNLSYWKVKYIERFVDNFKKVKNKSIIEVGTGSGYMAVSLAKLGAKVTACDITIKNLINLKKATETLGLQRNISFVCCSADQLPFKKGTFQYFVLNSVLEHIPKEKEAITEIERVLKKRGGLMVTVPVRYSYIFPPLLPLNYIHDKRIGHLRRYDNVSLERKFSTFKLKKMYFTGHPLKVAKVIINMIIKIFNEKETENEDAKKDNNILWSSNLIAFFTKK